MKRTPYTLVALFLLPLLAGCAAFPPPPGNQSRCLSPPDDSSPTDTATLRYYRKVSSYDSARLQREFAQRLSALEPTVCDQRRLEAGTLALLDLEIAEKHPDILKPCLASPDPEFANLALVLHRQIEHRRRSADQQADLRRQLAALKAENESVRKQLDALKDIEKSIHERDKRPPRTSQ